MAFPSAAGYTNLPNGVFSPVIFSKKAQKIFRKSSVVQDISNTDYFGEISAHGDSVRIIREPDITVSRYERGTTLAKQDLVDTDFTMVVDQANYFQFGLNDIEEAHSHVNWMELATDRAGYEMRDQFDEECLGYAAGYKRNALDTAWEARVLADLPGTKQTPTAGDDEYLASNVVDAADFGGTAGDSIPLAPTGGAGQITSPLAVLNRFKRIMSQANVPEESRWVVVDPVFMELLEDEDSKLVDADFGGNGQLMSGNTPKLLRGFKVYQSNNLPFLGTGPETINFAGSATNFGVIVAGHSSAIATAEQLNTVEKFRDPNDFGDICRGMHLYGRKILRSESIFRAHYNVA